MSHSVNYCYILIFKGWEYRPSNETCCGQCEQMACVLGDKLYKVGETWPGPDNCTTFSCLHVLGGVSRKHTNLQEIEVVSRKYFRGFFMTKRLEFSRK